MTNVIISFIQIFSQHSTVNIAFRSTFTDIFQQLCIHKAAFNKPEGYKDECIIEISTSLVRYVAMSMNVLSEIDTRRRWANNKTGPDLKF